MFSNNGFEKVYVPERQIREWQRSFVMKSPATQLTPRIGWYAPPSYPIPSRPPIGWATPPAYPIPSRPLGEQLSGLFDWLAETGEKLEPVVEQYAKISEALKPKPAPPAPAVPEAPTAWSKYAPWILGASVLLAGLYIIKKR